jgi:uncharacterized protein
MRLLIAGVSVRACAQSAVAAGHEVVAIDAYGDLDLRAIAEVMVVPPPYTAMGAAEMSRGVRCDAVAYTSNFENHPAALALLIAGRTCLGNSPADVARVREPGFLAGSPAVRTTPAEAGDWLLKPRGSGGGHGIRPWRVGQKVPRGMFLQERVEGTPGSVLFDGDRVLGATRQLIGDPAFGASGFLYCGNIVVDRLPDVLPALGCGLGLRGAFGIDFIARDGVAVPIEVNPRYTAAMELIERQKMVVGTVGKAIVYARRAVTVGDTREWLGDDSVADIPVPGTRVPAGRPICTVFASGQDIEECYARLVARADHVYAAVERRRVAA